jgi:fructose-1,6-bisphosphatase/inositol monophosphatase family enzyme
MGASVLRHRRRDSQRWPALGIDRCENPYPLSTEQATTSVACFYYSVIPCNSMISVGPIPLDTLVPYSIKLVRDVQKGIASRLMFHPEAALQRIVDPEKDPSNQPLRVDHYAEDYYGGKLEERFKTRICAAGEESLDRRPDLVDITNRTEIVAIMDIIDGTDLLLRRFGNWCSAIVFFYPPEQRILLSVVADHEGNVFYATHKDSGAYFLAKSCKSLDAAVRLHTETRTLSTDDAYIRLVRNRPSGPSRNESLLNALVCFVGQKPHSFLAAADNVRFCNRLRGLKKLLDEKVRPAPAFRLYNLGGIPMMPKVANGILDAVIGLQRPKPHDFVAGAYIALKAGAFLGNLHGRALGEVDLANQLNHPKEKYSPYIVSCTESLYEELVECLIPERAKLEGGPG